MPLSPLRRMVLFYPVTAAAQPLNRDHNAMVRVRTVSHINLDPNLKERTQAHVKPIWSLRKRNYFQIMWTSEFVQATMCVSVIRWLGQHRILGIVVFMLLAL